MLKYYLLLLNLNDFSQCFRIRHRRICEEPSKLLWNRWIQAKLRISFAAWIDSIGELHGCSSTAYTNCRGLPAYVWYKTIPITFVFEIVSFYAFLLDVIKGFDVKDSTTIRRPMKESKFKGFPENLKGLRVGIPREFHCQELSDEVVKAWSEVAVLMEGHGAIVSEVSLPHTAYSIACYSVLNPAEVASNMARYDGLRYGFRATGENLNSTESLYAANRSQAFNHIVRGRIFAGNYFLLKQ